MKLLNIRGLSVSHGYVQAIREVSLEAVKGEMLTIIGANGAGKSTLLGTIAGLYKPKAGEIVLNGRAIGGQKAEQIVGQGVSLVPERREIFGSLTVRDNLLLGAFHRYRTHKEEIKADLVEIMEIFPSLKGRESDLAASLSGGLQQMLAIGRGLMARPELLMLDEPSIGLAPLVVKEIMATLLELKKTGVTMILVEQNTKAAMKVADTVLVMERGRVTHSSNTEEIVDESTVRQAYLGRSRVEAAVVI